MPTLKRHLCGHRILCVLPRSVTRHSLIVWYDGEQGSPTFKREIKQCPGCGKKLTLASMLGGDLPMATGAESRTARGLLTIIRGGL